MQLPHEDWVFCLLLCCRTAARCKAAALERLLEDQLAIDTEAAAVVQAAADRHDQHWESLLQLKTKVDAVRDAVARKAEKSR